MTLRLRVVLTSLLALNAFAQKGGNFSLAVDAASVSVAAGNSADLKIQISVLAGYSQPIYLIPGALPEGVSVVIPSPVVGNQAITVEVRAAAEAKLQTSSVAIYAAGTGENHAVNFSVTVVPEGTLPEPPPVAIPLVQQPPPSMPLPTAPAPVVEHHSAPLVAPAPPVEPLREPLREIARDIDEAGPHWVGSWGASPVTPSNESGAYYLTNVTVRQVAHLSIGSLTSLRIKLSNALGRDPVSFASVHVAQWAGDASHVTSAILPATDRVVTFNGAQTVVIPAGAEIFSDPISLPLPPGADLAVSFYIPRSSNVPATMHNFGNQTAYFALGDATASTVMGNAATDTVRPYLTAVDVDAPGANAIVTLGDSLTDGMLSSKNQNLRWTDGLARRLPSAGIVNEGIAGNCVVMSCLGPTIPDRFKRDVLGVSGVRYLILQAGENDISNAPGLTAKQLTDVYASMVASAHAQNILVYGATIPPFGGSNYFTPAHEKLRQDVNTAIRTGGLFDAVIDFDKALADPSNPAYLLAKYSGDKIRPNDAGYQAMAEAVDLAIFKP